MKTASRVLLSFIVGALAGAATGILLAPDKGKITRKKMKDSINDLSEKAKETISGLNEKAKKTFHKEQTVKEGEAV
jgi:gas vesicle protein